ncbi:MAG: cytochrome C assembly protein, partial [Comamonas sp.]|nr:cytochrome C assembly protein [Comamonas sp.]
MLSQPLTAAGPVGWILALAAAIAYAIPALASRHLQETGARHCLRLAWALHALLLGWGLLGEQPRFGFAPALSITAWLVLTVYVVEQQLYPQLRSRWPLSILGS